MPRVQTRRSVSISGATYDRLRKHCTREGQSMSGLVEQLALRHLDAVAPAPAEPRSRDAGEASPPARLDAAPIVHADAAPMLATTEPEPTRAPRAIPAVTVVSAPEAAPEPMEPVGTARAHRVGATMFF